MKIPIISYLKKKYSELSGREKKILAVLLVVFLFSVAFGSYRAYSYVQYDPKFCRSCHLMEEPYRLWEESVHKNLICHDCHHLPPKEALMLFYEFIIKRPTEIPEHAPLPEEVCESCHVSGNLKWKQIADTVGHKIHNVEKNISCLNCHAVLIHRFEPPAEICSKCHPRAIKLERMGKLHCLNCHNYLVNGVNTLRPPRGVCLDCHKTIPLNVTFSEIAPMHFLKCATCHEPHTGGSPLNACESCHSMTTQHTQDKTCISCHRPHEWIDIRTKERRDAIKSALINLKNDPRALNIPHLAIIFNVSEETIHKDLGKARI